MNYMSKNMTIWVKASRRSIALALSAAILTSACQPDGLVTSGLYPSDTRARHPIALAYAPMTLDIFPEGDRHGFGHRQDEDIRQFAKIYTRDGRGPLLILTPVRPGDLPNRDLRTIKAKLAANGISGRYIRVQAYAASDSAIAAPIRLSFTKMQAKLAGQCGDWAQDIGMLKNFENWQNKPWYNMGCAYQSQFAAQVADPIDLIRPQVETRLDTNKRMGNIEKLRNGQDPATTWSGGSASIGKN